MKLRLLLIFAAACGADRHTTPPPPPTAPTAPSPDVDPRFVDAIRAGMAYATWGRVDEIPRAAPADCAMLPRDGRASHARLSDAAGGPHGDKLYFLWATDRSGYLADAPVAAGFAVVKESFHADPAPPAAANAAADRAAMFEPPAPIRTVESGGRRLQTGAPTGLYVMAKVGAADAAGTDAGWVYGTIAPDGTVTSAGRVAPCMRCHEDATHERLFGLKLAPGA